MKEKVRRTHADVARLLARLAIKAVVGTPDVWRVMEPVGGAVIGQTKERARRRTRGRGDA